MDSQDSEDLLQEFLRELRDHNQIQEDKYQEVSCMKNKEDIYKAIYHFLEPRLQMMLKNLTGSPLPEEMVKEGTDQRKRKELSEHEDEEEKSEKKKKKQRNRSMWDSAEKRTFPSFSWTSASPLNIRERNQLPVTCGDLKGTLYKDKLDKGEKSILFQQWFTPREFEKFSRRTSSKNWKKRIQCNGTPLGKVLEVKEFLYPGSTDEEETEEHTEFAGEASSQRDIFFEEIIKPLCVLTDKTMIKMMPIEELEYKWFSKNEEETGQKTVFKRKMSPEKIIDFEKDVELERKYLSVLTDVTMTKDTTDEQKESLEVEDENPENKQRSDEEQPGPSCPLTPASLLKSREKDEVSTSSQLPVTCGDLKATLYKDRLARGKKCILFEDQWFTPGQFEKRAGRKSSKKWKWSIRCNSTPLGKLIQEGRLKSVKYKGGCKKAKKSLFPSDQTTPEQEQTEEQTEQQQEDDHRRSKMVFNVTCGALAGTLHKKRFASGTRGKSIRMETRWMSPEEFVKEASGQTDASWKRDIECEGKPLSVLIEGNMLRIHSVLCDCELCQPDQEDLENQKNDDECFVCKSDEGADLVVCDHCPRSFHHKCHLPHVGDDILGDDKPWMCTFCILRTVERWRYGDALELEAAMSQQASRRLLECQYLLLFLCSADEEQTFASDPNLYLKNYSSVVQTPMWFGKVADKLQEREYHTVGEFVSDVQLIFTNCATYNRGNAEFLDRGRRLKDTFDSEFNKVFNIRLLTD